jgi:hypothetical protein
MTPDALALVVVRTIKQALVPMRELVAGLDGRLAGLDGRLARLEGAAAGEGLIRERLAALETRAPVPGPPGRDGLDGKAGADGLGVEDLTAAFDGERTLTLTFGREGRAKVFTFALPIPVYQGVWVSGRAYYSGDLITCDGSVWHCQAPTTQARPGERESGWRLMVKRGEAGRSVREPAPMGGR